MMIKTTEIPETLKVIHQIPAGMMPSDQSIELFGDRRTRKVFFTHKGKTYPFHELASGYRKLLLKQLMQDDVAQKELSHLPLGKALERYAFCMYGTLDHIPDINATGSLGQSDNFMCGDPNCNCKNWKSKQITYNGHVLHGRLLDVLLAYSQGREDSHVAESLDIKLPTLNTHKKRLFEIFGVYSKTELAIAAIEAKIIQ